MVEVSLFLIAIGVAALMTNSLPDWPKRYEFIPNDSRSTDIYVWLFTRALSIAMIVFSAFMLHALLTV